MQSILSHHAKIFFDKMTRFWEISMVTINLVFFLECSCNLVDEWWHLLFWILCFCVSLASVKCLELMPKCTWVFVFSGSDFSQKMSPLYHNAVFCVWEKINLKFKINRRFNTSFLFLAEKRVQNDHIKQKKSIY